jgi:hypothetical protein
MTTPPPRKRRSKPDTVPGTSGVGIDAENAFPKSEIPDEPEEKQPPKLSVAGRRGTTLKQPLMAMYGTIGFAVGMAKPVLGQAIMESAEQCAEAWDDLARQNASVKRVLEAMTKVSATGAVLSAHIPIIMAVTAEYRPDIAERFLSTESAA